jgi:hypothetical protein
MRCFNSVEHPEVSQTVGPIIDGFRKEKVAKGVRFLAMLIAWKRFLKAGLFLAEEEMLTNGSLVGQVRSGYGLFVPGHIGDFIRAIHLSKLYEFSSMSCQE